MNDEKAAQRKLFLRFIVHQLVTTAVFIVGILACYQGAVRGIPWLGPAVVALLAVIHFAGRKNRRQQMKVVLLVGGIGFLTETIMIAAGLYTPAESTRFLLPAPLCPLWILALWINFALKMGDYLWFMQGRIIRGFVVGFLFGVAIFHNASVMGVGTLNYGKTSLLLAAFVWGLIVPVLFRIAGKMLAAAPPAGVSVAKA
ncbi:MAG TPA: DUF2878 domain-containing protein [Elusimicrobiota bacterium]|nr:DUF2878 domain-containing protein [Elusimicrobiota bacterium]